MKIELKKIGDKYIELYLSSYEIPDLKGWDNLIFQTLLLAYYNKPVCLITLSPQKYSLGFAINNPIQMKVGKDTLLINFLESCSENILKEISESEEFKRGLLRLVTIDSGKLPNIVKDVSFKFLDIDNIDKLKFDFELVTCEGDGKILCWFNPSIPLQILKVKLQNASINLIEIT